MKNAEKVEIRYLVKREIALDHDVSTAIKAIVMFGYKPATIRKYYKALSK